VEVVVVVQVEQVPPVATIILGQEEGRDLADVQRRNPAQTAAVAAQAMLVTVKVAVLAAQAASGGYSVAVAVAVAGVCLIKLAAQVGGMAAVVEVVGTMRHRVSVRKESLLSRIDSV
jgi:hypothetical protein